MPYHFIFRPQKIPGTAHFGHRALMQHGDAVGNGEGTDHIVGHHHRRDPQIFL